MSEIAPLSVIRDFAATHSLLDRRRDIGAGPTTSAGVTDDDPSTDSDDDVVCTGVMTGPFTSTTVMSGPTTSAGVTDDDPSSDSDDDVICTGVMTGPSTSDGVVVEDGVSDEDDSIEIDPFSIKRMATNDSFLSFAPFKEHE